MKRPLNFGRLPKYRHFQRSRRRRRISHQDRKLTAVLNSMLSSLGRKERRHWARVYVEGLLLEGERKSIEPLAERIAGADVQALRQFVGQSPWPVEAVQRALPHKIVDLLSDPEVWILDETSFPKAGRHSV